MNQQLDITGRLHDIAPAHETVRLFDSAPQIKGQIALDTDAFCEQSGALKSECVGCRGILARCHCCRQDFYADPIDPEPYCSRCMGLGR